MKLIEEMNMQEGKTCGNCEHWSPNKNIGLLFICCTIPKEEGSNLLKV